jgi:hypothetical protein
MATLRNSARHDAREESYVISPEKIRANPLNPCHPRSIFFFLHTIKARNEAIS